MQINLFRRAPATAGHAPVRTLCDSELRHVGGGQRTRAILGEILPPEQPPI